MHTCGTWNHQHTWFSRWRCWVSHPQHEDTVKLKWFKFKLRYPEYTLGTFTQWKTTVSYSLPALTGPWKSGGTGVERTPTAMPCRAGNQHKTKFQNDISSRLWINKPHVLPFQLLIATPRLNREAENDTVTFKMHLSTISWSFSVPC